MPTYEGEIVHAARAVARYQRVIRDLRRRLKAAQRDLRLEQKHLRALAQREVRPDIVPLRCFDGAVGFERKVSVDGTN